MSRGIKIKPNEKHLVADALNGVGMLVRHDPGYLDLMCGNDGALLDAAIICRDAADGRVLLCGSRIASGLEHEIYDAIRLDRLDEKWGVDGYALLTELRAMTAAQ